MSKISDFKLAASVIREYCRYQSLPFIDFAVDFQCSEGIRNNAICVGDCSNFEQTLFKIVQLYLKNQGRLTGGNIDPVIRDNFLTYFAGLVRKATRDSRVLPESKPTETVSQRLYQRPLIWILMKDLFCPISKKKPKNVLLFFGVNPYIDVAVYHDTGKYPTEISKEPFIYANHSVENEAVLSAHILVAALEAHGIDPTIAIQELYESDLYLKMRGALKLAFINDIDSEEFEAVLFKILGFSYSDYPHIKVAQTGELVKESQMDGAQTAIPMMWWYLGLTEKMLEPVRGPDWSTRENLQGYIDDFWDQVDNIRNKKPQGDGVPYNQLLRMKTDQTVDNPNETRRIIQDQLSSQRIL